MLHSAAKNEPYACFVRPDTTIPFMAMPDAVKALVKLETAPQERLTQLVYNVTSFSISAQAIYDIVTNAFPKASITFRVDECRQKIIDTWPEVVDDSAAREDWGWDPDYDCKRSFNEYLIPAIRERYP
jgi:nucleoside-diphosphate-sugar epimerase